MKLKTLWLAALTALASTASAEMVMSSRLSNVDFDFLYGYANQGNSGQGADSDGNLLATDGIGLSGTDSGSGDYLGTLWGAGVTWDISQGYSIDGGLATATRISSSGITSLSSYASAPYVTSGVSSRLSGNQLALSFMVPFDQQFHLAGMLQSSLPLNRNLATIYIYRDDGAGWVTWRVVPANTTFDDFFTIPGGSYQIVSTAVAAAGGNENVGASWDYTLEVVPEPTSLVLLGLGAMALARRRKVRRG